MTARARYTQSWTNVAPVRHDSGHWFGNFMISPVASMTEMAPAVKAALSFWPALNLPMRTLGSRPRVRSQRRSSARPPVEPAGVGPEARPHRPASTSARAGTGRATPAVHVDGARPGRRRLTDLGQLRACRGRTPVTSMVSIRAALAQCRTRSPRSKRSSRAGGCAGGQSTGLSSRPFEPPDPAVDVVAVLLPVAGDDAGGDLDAVEPLERLVAVHRSDVEAHGPAVVTGHRGAEHLVGDDHVGPPGLVEREALGVGPVEGVEREAPCPAGFTPARSRMSRQDTPVQWTPGTRHPVTHWKSLTRLVGGMAFRSSSVRRQRVVDHAR